MKLRFRIVKEVIKKELKSIFRDKKSLAIMFLTPLMGPLFIFGFSWFYGSMESILTEDEYSIGVNYEVSITEQEIINELEESMGFQVKFVTYKTLDDMVKAYDDGKISAYTMMNDETSYKVYYNPDDTTGSNMAGTFVMSYLQSYSMVQGKNYLIGEDVDVDKAFNALTIDTETLSGKSYMVNTLISIGLTYVVTSIILAATYCATDCVAGEKERGTLETMLTFPISVLEIMFGKYAAIFIVCLLVSVFSLAITYGSLGICSLVFDIYKNVPLNVNVGTFFISLAILIGLSFISSGVCIALVSNSKSYKEAQELLSPIQVFSMAPMIITMLGINTNVVLSIIPIVGTGLVVNDISYGVYSPANIVALVISNVVLSILLIVVISRTYKSEKVLFGATL